MNISAITRGSLLISGTIIGAGMLGVPLVTSQAGFFPSFIITTLVWLFMLCTGLLFLEVTLWMKDGANILSMSKRFLGYKGEIIAGLLYLFLYYCLLVAYFSAGAPLFASFLKELFGISLYGLGLNVVFGCVFLTIIFLGIKGVDRVNYILMLGLIISFLALVVVGAKQVEMEKLYMQNWNYIGFAAPVLFTSFGFHNVIPSLTTYFKRDEKVMRFSIFFGTLIPFIVYVIWQWIIIGAIAPDIIKQTLNEGKSIIYALEILTHKPWIKILGKTFGFFALTTSLMGVSFSMVDFLGDGLKMMRVGKSRLILCVLTFFPPFLLASIDPSLFIVAIGLAGGVGEAFLNGILPVSLVWKGRYKKCLKSCYSLPGNKISLIALLVISVLVVYLEIVFLLKNNI